jgi:hypothetical protein
VINSIARIGALLYGPACSWSTAFFEILQINLNETQSPVHTLRLKPEQSRACCVQAAAELTPVKPVLFSAAVSTFGLHQPPT